MPILLHSLNLVILSLIYSNPNLSNYVALLPFSSKFFIYFLLTCTHRNVLYMSNGLCKVNRVLNKHHSVWVHLDNVFYN